MNNYYVNNLSNENSDVVNLFFLPKNTYYDVLPKKYFEKKTIKLYNTEHPYTLIEYKSNYVGQSLNVRHTQNINNKSNFSIKYDRQKSEGIYQNQEVFKNYFEFSYWLQTKNKRYYTFIDFQRIKIDREENGGIENDSVFIDGLFNLTDGFYPGRENINVNLQNASSLRINKSIRAFSKINLGKKQKLDSLYFVPDKSYLFHNIEFDNLKFYYNDLSPSLAYYPNIYIDSLNTSDSSSFKLLTNKFGWNHNSSNTSFFIETRHSRYKIINDNKSSFDFAIGSSTLWEKEKMKLGLDFSYLPIGTNQSSYFLKAYSNIFFSHTIFSLHAHSTIYKPNLFQQKYISNHFQWDNNFDFIFEKNFNASVKNEKRKFLLETNIFMYKNYVYFNDDCLPVQYVGNNIVFQLLANKKVAIKSFNLDTEIVYQKSSKNLIKVPEFTANGSAYFINNSFNNKAILTYGMNIFYFSEFYGNAYMPALGLFHLQNEVTIGNYTVFDLFLNFNIQNFNIGLIIEHVNAGFMGFNYFIAPNYPIIDRNLRFNLTWDFKD